MTTVTDPALVETLIIDGHTLHLPFADLLPALSADEYAALRDDIAQRGIQVPLMLSRVEVGDGLDALLVIDGQHRARVAAELDMRWSDVPITITTGTPDELTALAFDLNVKRRQLSREQRDQAAATLRQAGLSYRKIAASLGVSVETARRAVLEAGPEAQPDTITGADGKEYDAIQPKTRTQQLADKLLAFFTDDESILHVATLQGGLTESELSIFHPALNLLLGDNKLAQVERGRYRRVPAPAPVDPATWSPSDADLKLVRAAIRHTMVEVGDDRDYFTTDDVRRRTTFTKSQLKEILTHMAVDGMIAEVAPGWWKPAAAPAQQVEHIREAILNLLAAHNGMTVTALQAAVKARLGLDYLGSQWTIFHALLDDGLIRRGEKGMFYLADSAPAAEAPRAPQSPVDLVRAQLVTFRERYPHQRAVLVEWLVTHTQLTRGAVLGACTRLVETGELLNPTFGQGNRFDLPAGTVPVQTSAPGDPDDGDQPLPVDSTEDESTPDSSSFPVGTYIAWAGGDFSRQHVGVVREHVGEQIKVETWLLSGDNHDTHLVNPDRLRAKLSDNEYERVWTFLTRRSSKDLLCVPWKDHFVTLDHTDEINGHRYNWKTREKWDLGLAARVSGEYLDYVEAQGGTVQVIEMSELDERMQDIFGRAGHAGRARGHKGIDIVQPPVVPAPLTDAHRVAAGAAALWLKDQDGPQTAEAISEAINVPLDELLPVLDAYTALGHLISNGIAYRLPTPDDDEARHVQIIRQRLDEYRAQYPYRNNISRAWLVSHSHLLHDTVADACETLVASGELIPATLPDGATVYAFPDADSSADSSADAPAPADPDPEPRAGDAEQLAPYVAEAVAALRQHGSGMYYHELKKRISAQNGTINRALSYGVRTGELLKTSDNFYTLPAFALRGWLSTVTSAVQREVAHPLPSCVHLDQTERDMLLARLEVAFTSIAQLNNTLAVLHENITAQS